MRHQKTEYVSLSVLTLDASVHLTEITGSNLIKGGTERIFSPQREGRNDWSLHLIYKELL